MNTNMAVTSDAIHMLPGIYLTECTHWRSLLDDLAWLLLAFVVNFRIQSWTEIVDCSMVVQSISSNYDDGEKMSKWIACMAEWDRRVPLFLFQKRIDSILNWTVFSVVRTTTTTTGAGDTWYRYACVCAWNHRLIFDRIWSTSRKGHVSLISRWWAQTPPFFFFFFFRFLQFLQLPQCLPPFRMVVGLAYLSFQRCEQLKMVEGGGDSCWTHQLVKL